jgi:hypothetical protein
MSDSDSNNQTEAIKPKPKATRPAVNPDWKPLGTERDTMVMAMEHDRQMDQFRGR